MFVPSLSWLNEDFKCINGAKVAFLYQRAMSSDTAWSHPPSPCHIMWKVPFHSNSALGSFGRLCAQPMW